MYLIILSYFNSFTNIQDVEVFCMHQTIENAEKALEKYIKYFNFKSFLINKNLILNNMYETYSLNTNLEPPNYTITEEIAGYNYKFLIKEYKHIGEKKYSFIPTDEEE